MLMKARHTQLISKNVPGVYASSVVSSSSALHHISISFSEIIIIVKLYIPRRRLLHFLRNQIHRSIAVPLTRHKKLNYTKNNCSSVQKYYCSIICAQPTPPIAQVYNIYISKEVSAVHRGRLLLFNDQLPYFTAIARQVNGNSSIRYFFFFIQTSKAVSLSRIIIFLLSRLNSFHMRIPGIPSVAPPDIHFITVFSIGFKLCTDHLGPRLF